MRLVVLGRTGQVARELLRLAPEARFLARNEADLSDPEAAAAALEAAIAETRAGAVLNAAAYTAVDRAETERDLAHTVNAEAPGALARTCAAAGIPFVHVSTDYVFDGQGTAPFAPADPTGPLGAYGSSKLAGEEAVRAAGGPHAILRTSWVFSAHGANFVKTMLRLGGGQGRLRVVCDQIGGPTPAAAIAGALVTIAERLAQNPALTGTYHFTGAPDVGWDGFAAEIFALAGMRVAVDPIPTADYPTPAARPLNSRLDCAATEAAFGLKRPDWRDGLARVLKEIS